MSEEQQYPVEELKYPENFDDVLSNSGSFKHDSPYVVVDFFAEWCGPCKRYAPTFSKLSEQVGKHLKFVKVDVDYHDVLVDRYNVSSLPTFMIFKLKTDSEPESVVLSVTGVGPDSTGLLETKVKDIYNTLEGLEGTAEVA